MIHIAEFSFIFLITVSFCLLQLQASVLHTSVLYSHQSIKSCLNIEGTGLLVIASRLGVHLRPDAFIDRVGFQLLRDLFIETIFKFLH